MKILPLLLYKFYYCYSKLKDFVNLGEASEKEDETKVCPGNIRSKISAFQNQIVETNVNNEKVEEKKPEKSLSRRSSCSYNPLEPNASRRNSVSNDIGFEVSIIVS